jgi:hypothetical protein
MELEQLPRGKRGRTNQTPQLEAEVIKPPLGRCHPMPMSPRRIVPDMLLMPALQLGNPIAAFIQMVINDLSGCAFGWGVQYVATFHSTLFLRPVPNWIWKQRLPDPVPFVTDICSQEA